MGKEAVPGLTLHISGKKIQGSTGEKYVANCSVTLTAQVSDLAVWDSVLERLDGMTVYTVDDVTDAVIAAAQRRANRAEKQMVDTVERFRQENEQLQSQLSFAQAENDLFRQQLAHAQQGPQADSNTQAWFGTAIPKT